MESIDPTGRLTRKGELSSNFVPYLTKEEAKEQANKWLDAWFA